MAPSTLRRTFSGTTSKMKFVRSCEIIPIACEYEVVKKQGDSTYMRVCMTGQRVCILRSVITVEQGHNVAQITEVAHRWMRAFLFLGR